ncbi:MAG: TetM/TetW/TetO/TetS family tetracycline resistance ribosomal protection protein, partial [Hamadaea sp.]|nr:TetM/TetW/TetO/TetS family tetracycline resistance ribosomal protection protein [Hamadaea sp.]
QAAYAGSAITGDGVDALLAGLPGLLPSQVPATAGPLSGVVFKVERGPAGEKIAYTQIVTGTLRVRDRIPIRGAEAKVTALHVFDDGVTVPRAEVEAGRIAKVWGLTDVRIGDTFGDCRAATGHLFAPPTLETVVVPGTGDRAAVHTALSQLAEQDPLINLRQDDIRGELYLSLYGEVQKEVIQSTLAEQYGVAVEFRETTMICAERVTGVGTAVEHIFHNPFLATVGLRVEPGTPGSGITFRLDVPVEAMPLYVYKAVDVFRDALEQTVRETLQQGLRGWPVDDCVVTLTDCAYQPPGTNAGDYRKLLPLVLMDALREAGTVVCEPIHRLTLEGPADSLSPVLRLLAQHGATPYAPVAAGTVFEVTADLPAAEVHAVQQRLPGLTRGEGVVEAEFDHYRPVRGPAPERARTDLNPLHRKEYLLHVLRRV